MSDFSRLYARACSPILIFVFFLLLQSCHVGRYFTRNLADINDYKAFPARPIAGTNDTRQLIKTKLEPGFNLITYKSKQLTLEAFLTKTRSTSFLVVKEDKLIYEWYDDGFDSSSILPSFSVSKSVVSTMIGIAIADGYIESLETPVGRYLDESYDSSLQQISFKNLLNMRAGLNFRERYASPFSPMAKYYYGRRLDRYVRHLKVEAPPGSQYEYQSAATQLAGMALEAAIDQDFLEYLSEKLWIPAGMQDRATWNLDRKGGDYKYFCCLNTTARNYARFGLLFSEHGMYAGEMIVPDSWIEKVYNGRNNSRDSQDYPYYLGWRQTPDGGIFAKGILGQYIYINPGSDVVIVRTGKSAKGLDWGKLFMEFNSQLR